MSNKTIKEDVVKWPSLKKYHCKKGKGEHDFNILESVREPIKAFINTKIPYLSTKTYIYRCSVCGKKYWTDKVLIIKEK